MNRDLMLLFIIGIMVGVILGWASVVVWGAWPPS